MRFLYQLQSVVGSIPTKGNLIFLLKKFKVPSMSILHTNVRKDRFVSFTKTSIVQKYTDEVNVCTPNVILGDLRYFLLHIYKLLVFAPTV